jgi:hypothetical protein
MDVYSGLDFLGVGVHAHDSEEKIVKKIATKIF